MGAPLTIREIFKRAERPLVIAHRGFSDAAPENSMAAFRRAIDAGVDMIELDVRLSADDEFVVFHDKRLERTSAGRGLVMRFDSRDLRRIDNGSWYSHRFSRERIPLLRDVLPLTRHGALLNIEIKPDVESANGTPVEALLLDLLRSARATHRVMVSSFNHAMMKSLKRLDGGLVTGIIYNPIKNFRRPPSQLAAITGAEIFICSKYQFTRDVAEEAHRSGIAVCVYGSKSPRDIRRQIHLGADGIIANDPAMVFGEIELAQGTPPER